MNIKMNNTKKLAFGLVSMLLVAVLILGITNIASAVGTPKGKITNDTSCWATKLKTVKIGFKTQNVGTYAGAVWTKIYVKVYDKIPNGWTSHWKQIYYKVILLPIGYSYPNSVLYTKSGTEVWEFKAEVGHGTIIDETHYWGF